MSVQMPQRPEGMKPNESTNVSPIRGTSVPSHSLMMSDRGASIAAQVSLSHTARLTESFNARQSAQGAAAGLVYTHAVLDASHAALQREARIFDRQA